MFVDLPPPVISLYTAPTIVNVNLSAKEGAISPDMYNISVTQVISERQPCQIVKNDLITVTTNETSVQIKDLFEYRLYNLTVEAIYTSFGVVNSTSVQFMTSSTSKFIFLFSFVSKCKNKKNVT